MATQRATRETSHGDASLLAENRGPERNLETAVLRARALRHDRFGSEAVTVWSRSQSSAISRQTELNHERIPGTRISVIGQLRSLRAPKKGPPERRPLFESSESELTRSSRKVHPQMFHRLTHGDYLT